MASEPKPAAHWPSFREPHATGVAGGFALPTTWDEPSSKQVSWWERTAHQGVPRTERHPKGHVAIGPHRQEAP
jgi:hypothetical protein